MRKTFRQFLKRHLPYIGVLFLILGALFVFHVNQIGIFSTDFLAQLRLPGGGTEKLAGKELTQSVIGSRQGLPAIHYFVFSKGYVIITQILGIVATLTLVYFGIRMIIANTNEERVTEAKHAILMVFIGLAIVAVADFVIKEIFVLQGGTFIGETGTEITKADGTRVTVTALQASTYKFNQQVGVIVTFLRYIIQGIAFYFIIRAGLALIVGGQESDVLNKQKKVFMWGIVALVLIMSAEVAIKQVIFPVDVLSGAKEITVSGVQLQVGQSLIAQIINMILAFSGGVAVFALVVGAAMYATAIGGEQSTEKGKKIVIGSLMGLVIIFSAYTIIAEFIR